MTVSAKFTMKVNSILAVAFVGGASASPTKLEARQGVSTWHQYQDITPKKLTKNRLSALGLMAV